MYTLHDNDGGWDWFGCRAQTNTYNESTFARPFISPDPTPLFAQAPKHHRRKQPIACPPNSALVLHSPSRLHGRSDLHLQHKNVLSAGGISKTTYKNHTLRQKRTFVDRNRQGTCFQHQYQRRRQRKHCLIWGVTWQQSRFAKNGKNRRNNFVVRGYLLVSVCNVYWWCDSVVLWL